MAGDRVAGRDVTQGGISSLHRGRYRKQRVWKEQPGGIRSGLGTSPSIMIRCFFVPTVAEGTAESSARL